MHPTKMDALIHRQFKNVDISLDRNKKNDTPKMRTLAIFGLRAIAKRGPARIVEKALVL